MPITVGVDEQDVYPPRVLITVNGLVGGEIIEIFRVVSGVRTQVRTGYDVGGSSTAFLALDAELPFGVPVGYVAVVDAVEYPVSATTYTLSGGQVVISDAITDQAAEVVILAWPTKRFDRDASAFRASNGRSIVVSGPAGQFFSQIELYVGTDSSRANVTALLNSATANTIQIRQPGGYADVDCYVAVITYEVRRFSQDGSDERRIIMLTAVEVDAWEGSLTARGYTYQDLQDVYTGLAYNDLAGDYATYLLLAQAELLP